MEARISNAIFLHNWRVLPKLVFANERLLSLHALYYGIALTYPRALPLEH